MFGLLTCGTDSSMLYSAQTVRFRIGVPSWKIISFPSCTMCKALSVFFGTLCIYSSAGLLWLALARGRFVPNFIHKHSPLSHSLYSCHFFFSFIHFMSSFSSFMVRKYTTHTSWWRRSALCASPLEATGVVEGNIVAYHIARPGSIPGRVSFPGWGFPQL